jgi:hypothetical protein
VLGMLVRGRCGFDGVIGRIASGSARLRNWSGAKGDPDDGVDFTECGLCAPGVEMVKDGRKGPLGSGVRGGGVVTISGASSKVAELIHFSSRDPKRGEPNLGGDSGGIIRKISAK